MSVADIYDNRTCELGEGAFWHPERGQLFWCDILGKRLLSRDAGGQLEWQFAERPSALGWIDRDTLLIATETGLRRFDIASGEHELLAPLEAENRETRSNDGRADPYGGFWIGTMSLSAEEGRGAIWRYYGGAIERLYSDITIPNAICFSPDAALAYFADTRTGRIMGQTLDSSGWPNGAPYVFLDLKPEGLNPDGAVVDAQGGLWNAQWGAGRVARYLPDGRLDRVIQVGGLHTSCPAFGGADLTRLFVTTACEGIKNPDAAQGLTYTIETGITGQAEHKVIA
ncbi:SMP-30/gluconolactonase/LRE family protein [Aureimonas fodinaquatilis]|uniref:SMP-30/gluconolactonase/LRE family protein n=1 Tax=Aureimonas fodinaquatilis TaxID=2565783 RepID=A0A5B0DUL3_9HYPH|nr:SMP-30/gluconolactonase/LRE family protein [Aureimonas fodinaquatilis]KAA0969471.1 SMP-30/gluconolactonase/LRE family protein [Aureimonas fodinaquatilis]